MSQSIDIMIAAKADYNALEVYRYIRSWCRTNAKKQANYRKGHYWTYQTLKDIAAAITGMTVSKLRTIFKKLKALGVIITGNYNKSHYDRTTWYSVVEEVRPAADNQAAKATPAKNQPQAQGKPKAHKSGKQYISPSRPMIKRDNIIADDDDLKTIEDILQRKHRDDSAK